MESLQNLLADPESLLADLLSPGQQRTSEQLIAVTTTLGAYVDHVTASSPERWSGRRPRLAEAWYRYRVQDTTGEQAAGALFGLDLSRTQVDRGAAFVRGVVERAGEDRRWPGCGPIGGTCRRRPRSTRPVSGSSGSTCRTPTATDRSISPERRGYSGLLGEAEVPVEGQVLPLGIADHPLTVAAELGVVRREQDQPGHTRSRKASMTLGPDRSRTGRPSGAPRGRGTPRGRDRSVRPALRSSSPRAPGTSHLLANGKRRKRLRTGDQRTGWRPGRSARGRSGARPTRSARRGGQRDLGASTAGRPVDPDLTVSPGECVARLLTSAATSATAVPSTATITSSILETGRRRPGPPLARPTTSAPDVGDQVLSSGGCRCHVLDDDAQVRGVGRPGRQWRRHLVAPPPVPPVPPVRSPGEQRLDRVDGDGEPDVLGRCIATAALGHRGVHADDLGVGVDERPAGVARVDRGVRLEQPGQMLGRRRRFPRWADNDRPTAETMPSVTVGPPWRASALPMATHVVADLRACPSHPARPSAGRARRRSGRARRPVSGPSR